MILSRQEFDTLSKDNQLAISLIGMSGMGKSYRAKQLIELGFAHICCDDLIASQISELLPSHDVSGLAAWMEQPYSEGYQTRERQYLKLEEQVTSQTLAEITRKTTVDTTGSVIYLSPNTRDQLKEHTLIVYLEANQEVYDQMFQVYMADPKPVVWGASFNRLEDESGNEALRRCYPKLLKFRAEKYKVLADVVLPFETARDEQSRGVQFLEAIRGQLKT